MGVECLALSQNGEVLTFGEARNALEATLLKEVGQDLGVPATAEVAWGLHAGTGLGCPGHTLCKTHLGSVSMGYADRECWKCSTAVVQLLVREIALGSRFFNSLRCFLTKALPSCSISRMTGEEANHAVFGVNDWVGGPRCG
jgi:hypothetical protein